MKFTPTPLPGLTLIQLEPRGDDRGFFVEAFHQEQFGLNGIQVRFVQDNHSRSSQGVLRGLHAQLNHPQGKLVRVLSGEIYDVALDGRPDSPAFGRWFGAPLSAADFKMIYIPPGFFHGFCVTSPAAEVEYKCTDYYHPEDEVGILWNDPELKITWPLDQPVLSPKDRAFPAFREVKPRLEVYRQNKK